LLEKLHVPGTLAEKFMPSFFEAAEDYDDEKLV
jgi:hypothetical protein